ncbi:hypothetical protein [Bauldia litoralis]|uniref:Uncharacterized protein n=1 Tax=Bauldia litoralis TaxID=665467 RepID=A0A1G6EN43_9HYPH|nr:hypothetical protein [Bauldia litoralis]SDB58672.1 hypothetical protein SAMN02982931_04719 [Bauldia litoralis]
MLDVAGHYRYREMAQALTRSGLETVLSTQWPDEPGPGLLIFHTLSMEAHPLQMIRDRYGPGAVKRAIPLCTGLTGAFNSVAEDEALAAVPEDTYYAWLGGGRPPPVGGLVVKTGLAQRAGLSVARDLGAAVAVAADAPLPQQLARALNASLADDWRKPEPSG